MECYYRSCDLTRVLIGCYRLIKVVSDRVLLAYRLTEDNHPHPDDAVELSSYCQELFAIAESSRVNMDSIRDHHFVMSIRRALPGLYRFYSGFDTNAFYKIFGVVLFQKRNQTLIEKVSTKSVEHEIFCF